MIRIRIRVSRARTLLEESNVLVGSDFGSEKQVYFYSSCYRGYARISTIKIWIFALCKDPGLLADVPLRSKLCEEHSRRRLLLRVLNPKIAYCVETR